MVARRSWLFHVGDAFAAACSRQTDGTSSVTLIFAEGFRSSQAGLDAQGPMFVESDRAIGTSAPPERLLVGTGLPPRPPWLDRPGSTLARSLTLS